LAAGWYLVENKVARFLITKEKLWHLLIILKWLDVSSAWGKKMKLLVAHVQFTF